MLWWWVLKRLTACCCQCPLDAKWNRFLSFPTSYNYIQSFPYSQTRKIPLSVQHDSQVQQPSCCSPQKPTHRFLLSVPVTQEGYWYQCLQPVPKKGHSLREQGPCFLTDLVLPAQQHAYVVSSMSHSSWSTLPAAVTGSWLPHTHDCCSAAPLAAEWEQSQHSDSFLWDRKMHIFLQKTQIPWLGSWAMDTVFT